MLVLCRLLADGKEETWASPNGGTRCRLLTDGKEGPLNGPSRLPPLFLSLPPSRASASLLCRRRRPSPPRRPVAGVACAGPPRCRTPPRGPCAAPPRSRPPPRGPCAAPPNRPTSPEQEVIFFCFFLFFVLYFLDLF